MRQLACIASADRIHHWRLHEVDNDCCCNTSDNLTWSHHFALKVRPENLVGRMTSKQLQQMTDELYRIADDALATNRDVFERLREHAARVFPRRGSSRFRNCSTFVSLGLHLD
jgi:hypothetical protein